MSSELQIQNTTQPEMEVMKIAENKVKYINKGYKKLSHKIYDSKCDVKLSVCGTSFKVHKEVMAEACDYFSAMFSHDMKEKGQDAIEIKDISPNGFSAILDYFYHGNITLTPENIEDVLEVARFFHANWIVNVCSNFLANQLNLDNFNTVLALADKYWLGDLQQVFFHFLGKNLVDLTEHPKFLSNFSENLLYTFLEENVYVDTSETFVLKLVLNWVNQDPCTRKQHLLPLLKNIRFPLMDLDELEQIPEQVLDFDEIKEEVEKAKTYCYCISEQCLYTEEKFLQRGARKVLAMIFFTDDRSTTNIAYTSLDQPGICLEELATTLDVLYEFTSQCVLGNFLFTAGGYDTNYCSCNRVYRFDPHFRIWIEIASMLEPRVSFSMCSSKDRLFVFGGINHTVTDMGESELILSNCEMYVPEHNVWLEMPSLPSGSFDQAAAFWDNCLYVSGGISANTEDPVPTQYLLCHKLDTDFWDTKASMLYYHQGHSMTAIDGKLYVLGGYTSLATVSFTDCLQNEMYDVETNQWTEIFSTLKDYGHLHRTVALLDKTIYVIGGQINSMYLYAFNIKEETMKEVEILAAHIQKVAALQVAYPNE